MLFSGFRKCGGRCTPSLGQRPECGGVSDALIKGYDALQGPEADRRSDWVHSGYQQPCLKFFKSLLGQWALESAKRWR